MRYIDQTIFKIMGARLTATGLVWARIAIIFTALAALMSYGFGREMHWVHGAALAMLTLVVALAPDAAHTAWEGGRRKAAIAIGIFCTPLAIMEFTSHAGYAAGFRGVDVEKAKVSQVKFETASNAAGANQSNVGDWRKLKAEKVADRKRLTDGNPWVTSTTADALRADLANVEDRAAREAAQGRDGRKKGCGKVCEQLQDQVKDLKAKIANVESLTGIDKEIAELDKQIAATQRVIDTKAETIAKMDNKFSAIGHQTGFFARVASLTVNGDLKVNDVMSEGAEHSLAIGLAFAFTFGPALAWFVAGMYRKEEDEAVFGGITGGINRAMADVFSAPATSAAPLMATGTTGGPTHNTTMVLATDAVARQMQEMAQHFVSSRKLPT